ncbi:hypothetical protein F5148DRAFT_1212957, partial [Russula earlei]
MAAAAPSGSGCKIASFVHATLCTAQFLLVILSGALVVWYAKLTGSDAAFVLHGKPQVRTRLLACPSQWACSYTFSWTAMVRVLVHKASRGCRSFVVVRRVGFWIQRMPDQSRTHLHSLLLGGLGGSIVLLGFYDAWLGLDV